ncbi:unnamed protein product [Echinostoma caproni]|uniref:Clusterin-associated protein 1 n=1 Tax=Echinostoma caproni TaxID=27848 RepID=A0A183ACB3_9TREM|nr:unnamed protein product [Echinostoma caproni]
MSYREMRTFTEMMRSLGFPRLISMENFRQPNFPLVAEILAWLVLRYDSHADIPQCLDTEQDRVLFVKMIAHFMVTRACIRLNTKKLYQANGFAVKELLKIAKILYSAMCENRTKLDSDKCIRQDKSSSRMFCCTNGRQLALSGQLASCGASLHALIGREVDLREARDRAIRRQLDSEWVERCVANARDELKGMIEKTETSLVNVAADETNLDEKIEKKRNELERNRKRLSTLQSVRPAYMEEYEQLEEELGSWYSFYLTRFRNLAYLENQYEELTRSGALGQSEEGDATLRAIEEQLKYSGVCQTRTSAPFLSDRFYCSFRHKIQHKQQRSVVSSGRCGFSYLHFITQYHIVRFQFSCPSSFADLQMRATMVVV